MHKDANKLMDAQGFDQWTKSYDTDVAQSDAENQYPFAAYSKIQSALVQKAKEACGKKVLDIGIGTGKLAEKLIQTGFEVTGIDFSEEMLAEARRRNPAARLISWDYTQGLPPVIAEEQFDLVFCNYAIHHLSDEQKQRLISVVMERLSD